MKTRKPMRMRLRSARSYYRLAAKASRNGEWQQAQAYRQVAYRLVDQDRAEQARMKKAAADRAAWHAKMVARQAAKAQEAVS